MMAPVRLLLVDDSAEVGTLVRLMARKNDWNVQTVPHAEAALELLNTGADFDLTLLDVNLPGMSGLELGRRLLTDTRLPLAVFLQSGLYGDLASAARIGIPHAVYKDYLSQPKRWAARCWEILEFQSGNVPDWILHYHRSGENPHPDILLDELTLTQALERGLGRELANQLAPILLSPLSSPPTAHPIDPRQGLDEREPVNSAARLLFRCWQFLGSEEVQELRKTLAPFLQSYLQGG